MAKTRESIRSVGVNVDSEFEDGELDAEDAAEFDGVEFDVDRFTTEVDTGKMEKKKMHECMLKNPWSIGREAFAKTDVVHIRSEAERVRKQKSDLRRCLLNNIQKEDLLGKKEVAIAMDVEGVVQWQNYLRSRPNNLSLL